MSFIAKISPVAQTIPSAESVISTKIFLPSILRSFPFSSSFLPIGVGALKSTLSDAVTHLMGIIAAFSRSIFSARQAKAAAEPVPWQSNKEANKPP